MTAVDTKLDFHCDCISCWRAVPDQTHSTPRDFGFSCYCSKSFCYSDNGETWCCLPLSLSLSACLPSSPLSVLCVYLEDNSKDQKMYTDFDEILCVDTRQQESRN